MLALPNKVDCMVVVEIGFVEVSLASACTWAFWQHLLYKQRVSTSGCNDLVWACSLERFLHDSGMWTEGLQNATFWSFLEVVISTWTSLDLQATLTRFVDLKFKSN